MADGVDERPMACIICLRVLGLGKQVVCRVNIGAHPLDEILDQRLNSPPGLANRFWEFFNFVDGKGLQIGYWIPAILLCIISLDDA